MPNLPGRNGVASSIHYPLPQPAVSPLAQEQLQQIVWYFSMPLGLTIPFGIGVGIILGMQRKNTLVDMPRQTPGYVHIG